MNLLRFFVNIGCLAVILIHSAQATSWKNYFSSKTTKKFQYVISHYSKDNSTSVCLEMFYPLAKTDITLTDYLVIEPQLKITTRSVNDKKFCINGFDYGKKYTFTIKAGLPAADPTISPMKTTYSATVIFAEAKSSTCFMGFQQRLVSVHTMPA